MSHLTKIKIDQKMKSKSLIKSACKKLGLQVEENGLVRSFSSKEKCDLVIKLKKYDVGLKYNPKTKCYDLYYDKFGGHVEKVLGLNCSKLLQYYTLAEIEEKARINKYMVNWKEVDGDLEVELYESY